MSISYYLYLVHERNEVNRLRRRLGAKKNLLRNNIGKDKIARQAHRKLEDRYFACQDIIRKHSLTLRRMAKQLAVENDWSSSTGTIGGVKIDGVHYNKDYIIAQHKEYVAECVIMGIEIVNLYSS